MPGPEEKEEEKKELTFDDILKDLPITDEAKQALTNVFTNLASSVVQTTQELVEVKAKLAEIATEASKATAETYKGLTADQIYNIEMAKAAGPAQQAQFQLLQGLATRSQNPGGGLDQLFQSAEKLTALRNFLTPPPSALQVAQEKAQIHQMIAQTRLMNKVTGKQTDSYLDHLEKELGGEGGEEGEE